MYLTDFGLSRHIEGSDVMTRTGVLLGTIDYIAPEQVRGDRVDARTDVYSLGCVLFEALSGTVPYPLDNEFARLYAHESRPPPSVCERAPDVSKSFEAVLRRAMAKAPEDRYLSAGDLGRAALAAASNAALSRAERSAATGVAAPPRAEAVPAGATSIDGQQAPTQLAAQDVPTQLAAQEVPTRLAAAAAPAEFAAPRRVFPPAADGGSSSPSWASQRSVRPRRRSCLQCSRVKRSPYNCRRRLAHFTAAIARTIRTQPIASRSATEMRAETSSPMTASGSRVLPTPMRTSHPRCPLTEVPSSPRPSTESPTPTLG